MDGARLNALPESGPISLECIDSAVVDELHRIERADSAGQI